MLGSEKRKSYFLLVLLLVFITSGCTSSPSKKLAASYGQATAVMTSTVIDKIHEIHDLEISLRIINQLQGFGEEEVFFAESSISNESILLRISLLDQLGRYGKALESIASDSELENIDKASMDLYGSLSGLNATVKQEIAEKPGKPGISDNDLGVIATAVNVIARTYFEYERHQKLKEIVEKSDPLVGQVVDLLQQDLLKGWQIIDKITSKSDMSTIFTMTNNRAYRFSDDDANLEYFQIRRDILEEAMRINIHRSNIEKEFKALDNGLFKVKDAHQKLREALKNDSNISSMRELISAISQIRQEIARAKSFKDGLSKP